MAGEIIQYHTADDAIVITARMKKLMTDKPTKGKDGTNE